MQWSATLDELRLLLGGSLIGPAPASAARLRRVVVDSRVGLRAGDLFVALPGAQRHGVEFAQQAWSAGAAVLSDVEIPDARGPLLTVPDVTAALQRLAAEYRGRYGGEVIAITGSNGKTIVKELVRALLRASSFEAEVAPLSWNSQVGVPLAILGMSSAAQCWVVECGISEPGEMARLAEIVEPTIGVWTNIGSAHGETLGGRPGIASEKAQLFVRGGEVSPRLRLVVAASDDVAAALTQAGLPADKLSLSGTAELRAAEGAMDANVRVARQVVRALGGSAADDPAALRDWSPPSMRLQEMQTPLGWTLINDAGTSDAAGVAAALKMARALAGERPLRVVLGPLALDPGAQARAHAEVADSVAAASVASVAVVADPADTLAAPLRARLGEAVPLVSLSEREQVATYLNQLAEPKDVVLLKASRQMHLGDLAGLLSSEVPPTRALVDLDALVGNWRAVKDKVGPKVEVMAVLKAFGYGLDASRLGRALQSAGASWLGVAFLDEALELRRAGVTASIMVQNVFPHEAALVVKEDLDVEVTSLELLDALAMAAERAKVPVRVHIKVDTGMARVGFKLDELVEVARRVQSLRWIRWDGLMTHFAAADDPAEDDFTRSQLERFAIAKGILSAQGVQPRWLHAANTAATARFPDAHGTMVRLGIGLYGATSPEITAALALRPVVSLRTRVLAVRDVSGDETVGYGRSWHAPTTGARIATVAVGYADGYPRALSNCGWMVVRGQRAPVVGRVCMDVTMLDVSGIDGVRVGDDVVVYGPDEGDPSLYALAEEAGTIAYELLTRLAPRARRVFERRER